MQEFKKKVELSLEKDVKKTVIFFIESRLITMAGDWKWTLTSDAIFCSDVILSLPSAFEGTRAIIHPDDLAGIKQIIQKEVDRIAQVEFRIITTFGEVKSIAGESLVIEKTDVEDESFKLAIAPIHDGEAEIKSEYENFLLQKEVYERTEKLTGTAVWYYNNTTNETWYSSNVFKLHNLPAQSLNAHLNTFTSFIHPEDREHVVEFTSRAFKRRSPLHIQYRVITTAGEKLLSSITQWSFNSKGEEILSGTLQDITEQKTWEENLEAATHSIGLFKQQLLIDEQQTNIAHWQLHLLTRKTIFSDNYYRIFGLRPNAIPAGFRNMLNYIHPEDRDMVSAINKKMIYEHVAPDIDYRIIRSDGKLRYIRQKAKLVTYGSELVIVGIIQDVTVQKMLEKKIAEITEQEAVKNFIGQGVEGIAGVAHWVWDTTTGETAWSDNFYKLLGFKPGGAELSQKLLLAHIHPEDQKKFKEHQTLALQQDLESEFGFRLAFRGTVKFMKASFRLLKHNGVNLFVGTVQDATKEILLEKQLKHDTQLAEALSENILDRIIITDVSNNILSWNRECERNYGVKKEVAIGSNFFDVFPKLKTEEDLQRFGRVLKGEKISMQGVKSVMGRGYYNLHMTPLWDESNTEIVGIIHIIHDVTKEHELKQNLNERLNFISNLLEASVDRIIALDHNMNYLYWNKKAEEYYGISKDEVVGKNILEIFPSVVNDPSYGEFRKVLRGAVVHIPASANPNGKREYYETYLIPIKDEEDDVSGVLWIAHDLSREYELQMRSNKEREVLEALNENYFELDSDYRVVFVNQSGLDFLNLSREQIIGKTIWEISPRVIDTPFYFAVKKAMEEGVSTRTELKSPMRGTWMNISVAPTTDGVIILSFDIENIKSAQEKLQNSKEILEAVFNASLHGLILLKSIRNEKKKIVDFEVVMNNAVIEKWNGRSLVGERYAESFPVVKQNGMFEGFIKVVELGESLNMEVHYANEGFDNWFCITAVKMDDGLVATAEDITERKKAEEDLGNAYVSLALQNNIYEHAENIGNFGTWSWNMQTNKAKYSDNMFRLFGMKPQEVEPNFETIPKFIHPEDRERLLEKASLLKEGAEPIGIEYRVIRKDGAERIFRNRIKIIRSLNGEKLVIGTTQDITEETELRKRLVESTQYAEKIIDATINRIHAVDTEMTIIAWNKRSEEITGIKRENAIGKKIFELFPKLAEDEVIRKAYENSLAGNYVHLKPKRSVYSQFVYERFFIPLENSEDRVTAVVNILVDVTDLLRKEGELKELNKTLEQKNRELEQKNDEITSFAFVASHDLREPLRKIHTFSDWLLLKESDNLNSKGKDYLARISASVKRMNMFIDDILVLTKVNSDTQKAESVNLNTVYKTAKADLDDIIKQKNAIIKTNKLLSIRGNQNHLIYLFRNLLDNAIKFQPEGQQPVITISCELIDYSTFSQAPLNEAKEYVKLSFQDNGIGFDRKYKAKIFRVFQQLKDINHEGSGMGLTICKKVMDNHDGFITAESEPGKGATFNCYFPV